MSRFNYDPTKISKAVERGAVEGAHTKGGHRHTLGSSTGVESIRTSAAPYSISVATGERDSDLQDASINQIFAMGG